VSSPVASLLSRNSPSPLARADRPAVAADFHTAPTERAITAQALPRPVLPGDYTLDRLAHLGRDAELWEARDAAGRKVAIKLARARHAAGRARFAVEARALASLTHRSVVRLLGHGDASDGRPFLALERLDGRTLRQLLVARRAGIPPRDAIRLLMPIASALVVAHDRGFVHGDVRAENVVVVARSDGYVLPRLIDFSSAKRLAPPRLPLSSSEPTPRAEEPADAADPALDVRGIAATIFHAIAGHAPFSSPGAGPVVPRTGLSERDAALWRILAEGLAPPDAGRFKGIHDLARELSAWADLRGLDADVTGSPISARWR
jgi:serine/threonine protein kinase